MQPHLQPIPRQKITRAALSADPRYNLLQTQSPSSSHTFLYSVWSTKVYCLPTCTARPARRANVIFFNMADNARRDGFRPCK
ncbi:metal binding domain of Ada-domain-containing protein [Aspergillus carlsbadensis]|nr:metal binding domain of Ada-domain-containing protein [Aspergillus carlsbadensis]